MTTQRQIDANRENARKSTGPTTEEGKIRSRRNAVKHGLAGKGIVLPDESAEALETRLDEWRVGYAIHSPDQEWQFRHMVVNSLRVDQCQEAENALRIHEASRASTCWYVDRIDEVEQIGAGLTKRPGLAVARLRRTRQGCEWLIEQWQVLDYVVAGGLTLTEEQEVIYVSLLGVRPEFHLECSPRPEHPIRETAAREIARLQKLKTDGLDELDEMERDMAEIGHPATSSKALERLRRYEAACLREFYRARAELLGKQAKTPEPAALEIASLGPVEHSPLIDGSEGGVAGEECPGLRAVQSAGASQTPPQPPGFTRPSEIDGPPAPCPAFVPVPEPETTLPTPEMTASEDDEPVQVEPTSEQPRQAATTDGLRDAVAARKARNRRQSRAARKRSRNH